MTSGERVDWLALARRLSEVQAKMIHHEDTGLRGDEFNAEVLRRTFRASAPEDPGHRVPYETVGAFTGLVTVAESDHVRDGHSVIDRLNRERAERERDEARAEVRRVRLDAQREVAKAIRGACNERTVPSRYRREGVLLAADWVDPGCPVGPYSPAGGA